MNLFVLSLLSVFPLGFITLLLSILLLARVLFHYYMRPLKPNRLPPGSFGWPYVGETLRLYTQDPNSFFSARHKRYGNIFKTHILGCPCVMVSSPATVKTVLVSEAHLFKPTYPASKERMIGPEAVFFQQGSYHSMLRNFVQASFLPSAIKYVVPDIERILLSLLPSWTNTTINTLQQMKRYAFEVAVISAFGREKEIETERIKYLYLRLEEGYNSYPLNLPGSSYRTSLRARKDLNETLRRVMQRRMESRKYGGGLLGVLLKARAQKKSRLTDSQIVDNLIGVIFAAHDTTASVLTWVLKYLHDNVQILRDVIEEQGGIKNRLTAENRTGLTWDDTRQMPFTGRVIQETMRCASVVSFTFREAVRDVELGGYYIPKGWKVLPLFRSIHHCAHFFPNPDKFDPSRFEVAPRPNTYMPFGNGVHSCPGNEMSKLQVFVLLHHLAVSYKWEVIGDDDGIEYSPFPVPKRGLPIKISPRNVLA